MFLKPSLVCFFTFIIILLSFYELNLLVLNYLNGKSERKCKIFFYTQGPRQEAKVGNFSLEAINKIAAVLFDKSDVRDGFQVANCSSSILCDSKGMQQIRRKYPNNVTSNQR